jgi:hypothetical protein
VRSQGLKAALVVAAVLLQRAAIAQEPAKPKVPEEEEIDPEAGRPREAAKDFRSGHVVVAPRFGVVGPTGTIATRTIGISETTREITALDLAGTGPAVGGVLGVGLTRHVVLEASGSYAFLSGSARCATCTARVFDVGLGLSYHLAQGTALDPWLGFGVGYRNQRYQVEGAVAGSAHVAQAYHGLDVARLALGADYFPVSFFGFGPFLGVDIGTNLRFPSADQSGSVYAFFQAGLRVVFDPLRISATAPPPKAARR